MSVPNTTSVIHDIGYKPYTGPRMGRWQILRALYVHGLRAVFGFGRGPWAKVVPWFVVLIMTLIGSLNIYAASQGKTLVMDYSVMGINLALLTILFVAVVAPELVSRDLRHHTLPLYFSRPLRRTDYPLAKVLALTTAVLIVMILPVLLTYIGQIASAKSGHEIWLDTRAAFPGVFVAVMQAAVFGVVSLLLAASTGRRVIATGLIAIFFLVTVALSAATSNALGKTFAPRTANCVVPEISVGTGVRADGGPKVFPVGGGPDTRPDFLVTALCPGYDLNNDNIDHIDGKLDPSKSGYADITMHYFVPVYSAIAKAGGLINPENLVEGTRIWVFDATDSDQPNPSPLGPVYALELALVVFAGTGGLFLRYRKVSVS